MNFMELWIFKQENGVMGYYLRPLELQMKNQLEKMK